jgi:hypothetical protein
MFYWVATFKILFEPISVNRDTTTLTQFNQYPQIADSPYYERIMNAYPKLFTYGLTQEI